MRNRTSLLILLWFGTGLSPTLHADGGSHARVFEPSPCPVAFPAGIQVDCGFLVVPENRRDNGNLVFRQGDSPCRGDCASVVGCCTAGPDRLRAGRAERGRDRPRHHLSFSPACSAPTAT